MTYAISVVGLGKRYQLGMTHSWTLKELVNRAIDRLLRRPSGHLPHVAGSVSIPKESSDEDGSFWALRDVSFEVQPGEIVGIIGRNGAGKSTLLKILSRITSPTTGRVEMSGRVASLLEVGTGFHPEMSGRENVFLNGTLLGLKSAEIRSKFDDIVAFAELEKFIDTPVKRYSSGMYVRLAFAVAAHLEPEILIVDEVLAVGDGKFQKKCLQKMGQVAEGGITVLLVSHNLGTICALASKCAWMESGKLNYVGDTKTCVGMYRKLFEEDVDLSDQGMENRRARHIMKARLTGFAAQDVNGQARWVFKQAEPFAFVIRVRNDEPTNGIGCVVALMHAESGIEITGVRLVVTESHCSAGSRSAFKIVFPGDQLRPGDYAIRIWLTDKTFDNSYDALDENVGLPLLSVLPEASERLVQRGFFAIKHDMQLINVEAKAS